MVGRPRALVAFPEEVTAPLLETVPDAMVLSDHDGRIVLVNSNTEKLFGYPREELLGKRVEVLIPTRLRARHRHHRENYNETPRVRPMGKEGLKLLGLRKDGTEFPAEIRLSPVQMGGKPMVWSAVRDVTERERLIEELRNALDDLKLLRGLLSICASCKRIRNEHGGWEQLESYIQSHSAAQFTHGLCPDCIRRLYPDYQSEER